MARAAHPRGSDSRHSMVLSAITVNYKSASMVTFVFGRVAPAVCRCASYGRNANGPGSRVRVPPAHWQGWWVNVDTLLLDYT